MTASFSLETSVKEVGARGRQKVAWSLERDQNGDATFDMFLVDNVAMTKDVFFIAKEEEETRGFDRKAVIYVDGVRNGNLELLKPFGKIEAYARLDSLRDLIKIYRELLESSPVSSGLYKKSHAVIINDSPDNVIYTLSEFIGFVRKSEKLGIEEIKSVRFVNMVPYAARLEVAGAARVLRGKNKGTKAGAKTGKSRKKDNYGQSFKKPNGVYLRTYNSNRSKVKGFFKIIRFQMIPYGFKGIGFTVNGPGGQKFRTSYIEDNSTAKKRKRSGTPYVYPSIVFRLD